MMHMCVSKISIIASDKGLSASQFWLFIIILTNAVILLIGSLGINFSEILIEMKLIRLGGRQMCYLFYN